MEDERGKEADHAVRDALGDLDQGLVFTSFKLSVAVEPAAELCDLAPRAQPAEVLSDGSTPGFTTLLTAQDINDSGLVVGTGMYFDGASSYRQAYSLTISSVPELSASAAILGAAVAAAVALHRLH